MSKRQTLMVLGIWVIILPFLGFPGFWGRLIMLATGILITVIAYAMRPQARDVSSNVPYVEHKNSVPSKPVILPVEKPVVPPAPAAEAPPTTPIPPVHN